MPDIDIGQLSEVINDKMDRDLNNRTTDSGLRRLIESYHNGTEWYKVFEEIQSDGTTKQWCEQGGTCSGTADWYSITFLKPFIDNNYIVMGSVVDTDNNAQIQSFGTYNKTATGIQVANGLGGSFYTNQVSWKAEGYIS